MEYIGEHILVGTIGQSFISIAFSAAILAAYSFYKSSINESLNLYTQFKQFLLEEDID